MIVQSLYLKAAFRPLLPVLVIALLAACSKSDDQVEFEQHALSFPQGVAEMDNNGNPVAGGEEDPDDWRVAPMFRGLIEINAPAYPNPVVLNNRVTIELYLEGLQTLNGIEIVAFHNPDNRFQVDFYDSASIPETGVFAINLTAGFDPGGSGRDGLFRLLIYDGNDNLITYGDVEVR